MSDEFAGIRVGMLHTVPSLAGTFQTQLTAEAPGIDLVHIADPSLLDTAIRLGVTDEVYAQVAKHVGHLHDSGALAVLVTCSSIGEAVEAAAEDQDIPVLRVDAPMAAEAVRFAREAADGRTGRIRVLATLAATLGPTGRLIERQVDDAGIQVESTVVEGAIAARDSGDQAGHDRRIAEAVTAAAADADVIVLAQASMAKAIDGVDVAVPVLTSPESGVASLLAALRAGGAGSGS